MKIQLSHSFEDIIGIENLLGAWKEFVKGKRGKRDVQEFSFRLMDNILQLHEDLANRMYSHGGYEAFNISDPKPRNIHKASVRDRLLHHALYRKLYPFFDHTFIADSFSCRLEKGTHKALNRFRSFAYKVSKNNTKTCWVLKCDIKKFFANINHAILNSILKEYIPDEHILWLLKQVIRSFSSVSGREVGLPLGNLTSQLFANIYMNELDQFVKHRLRVKYYMRYADDFVLLSGDPTRLKEQMQAIHTFLRKHLHLSLHPNKIFLQTLASGVDFLGWVHFPDHRVIRTTTKRRMMKRIESHATPETVHSYLGLLRHRNTYRIQEQVAKACFLRQNK